MTFRYTKASGKADFGTLGASAAPIVSTGVQTGVTAGATAAAGPAGGLAAQALAPVTGAVTDSAEACCGCGNKAQAAKQAAAQQAAAAAPLKQCAPGDTQCQAYNQQQLQTQQSMMNNWQQTAAAAAGAQLAPSDQARFAFVSALAQKLKAMHPEAGGLTLSQIYKQYPDDFDAAYAQIQQTFPWLKNIDPQTALAMNPGIANMTLDDVISTTTALGAAAAQQQQAAASSGGFLLPAGLLMAGGLLFMLRKQD